MILFQCTVKNIYMMKEQQLIAKIEESLPRLLPSVLKVGSFSRKVKVMNGGQVDILASLKGPLGSQPIKLAIEVKSTTRLSSMLEAAYQAKRYAQEVNATPLVAGNFLGERTRDLLKQEGVSYLDLAGNFYLSLPNLYAEKIVDKNPFSSAPPLKNIFAPVSSRIARVMLSNIKKMWHISELSNVAQVSIGQTYNVLEALKAERLASKNEMGKWIIDNPTALLDAWRTFYPAYRIRKYNFFSYSPKAIPEMVSDAAKRNGLTYAMGLFSGADMIAPFIRGLNKVQFYTDEESVEKWCEALKLKEVQSGGNIEIYVPYDKGVFYDCQLLPSGTQDTVVVSNLQLYLDLFNDASRGEEAAEYLRKQKIGF
jgi:hypothetical protein